MVLPDAYVTWNAQLLDYCLENIDEESGHFTLAVHQMLDETGTPDAETNYISAVRCAYINLLSVTHDPLSYLLNLSHGKDYPLYIAFLGVAVLASEEMHGNEYYEHLATLLNQPQSGSSVHGFVHKSFEQCWLDLNNRLTLRDLWMSMPNQNGRRYVSWPKMHALLRAVDVEKLPRFFRENGLSPLRSVSDDYLSCFFSLWIANGQSGITTAGIYAWHDGLRQPSILRQIIRVLNLWDETTQSVTFQRTSAVTRTRAKLIIDFHSGKPSVYIRARQLDGFADKLASGLPEKVWQSGEKGQEPAWYKDIALSNLDFEYLPGGFETPNGLHRVTFRGGSTFVFILSEYGTNFEVREEDGLPLNAPCAILCRKTDEKTVSDYLRRIAAPAPSITNMSMSWTLFHSFRPIFEVSPPLRFEMLRVVTSLTVHFIGGLGTGQPLTWLDSSPPQWMTVNGRSIPSAAFINDVVYKLTDSEVQIDEALQTPGQYIVRVGSLTRRISITPVRVKCWDPPLEEAAPVPEETLAQMSATGLIPDDWTLLGATAGEISEGGAKVQPFNAQWALGRNPAGYPAAIALVPTPTTPLVNSAYCQTSLSQRWAKAILAIPQSSLGSVCAKASRHNVQAQWRKYISAASYIRQKSLRRLRVTQEKWW